MNCNRNILQSHKGIDCLQHAGENVDWGRDLLVDRLLEEEEASRQAMEKIALFLREEDGAAQRTLL